MVCRSSLQTRLLHAKLSQNPSFFAEVIAAVYRAKEQPKEDSPNPRKQNLAYFLIRCWNLQLAKMNQMLRTRLGSLPRDVGYFAPPFFLVGHRRREAYARNCLGLLDLVPTD